MNEPFGAFGYSLSLWERVGVRAPHLYPLPFGGRR